MQKFKGELQNDNGDIMYPHTTTDIVFDSTTGKSLSDKLTELEQTAGGDKYVHPDTHPASMITGLPEIVATLTEETTGNSLDATMGKVLNDKIDAIVATGGYVHPDTHPASMITGLPEVKNTLTETMMGNVLDATQGKVLNDKIDNLIIPEVKNTLTETTIGNSLDSTQGKILNDKIEAVEDRLEYYYNFGRIYVASQVDLDAVINTIPNKNKNYSYEMLITIGFSNSSVTAVVDNSAGGLVKVKGSISQDLLYGHQEISGYPILGNTITRNIINGVWEDWAIVYNDTNLVNFIKNDIYTVGGITFYKSFGEINKIYTHNTALNLVINDMKSNSILTASVRGADNLNNYPDYYGNIRIYKKDVIAATEIVFTNYNNIQYISHINSDGTWTKNWKKILTADNYIGTNKECRERNSIYEVGSLYGFRSMCRIAFHNPDYHSSTKTGLFVIQFNSDFNSTPYVEYYTLGEAVTPAYSGRIVVTKTADTAKIYYINKNYSDYNSYDILASSDLNVFNETPVIVEAIEGDIIFDSDLNPNEIITSKTSPLGFTPQPNITVLRNDSYIDKRNGEAYINIKIEHTNKTPFTREYVGNIGHGVVGDRIPVPVFGDGSIAQSIGTGLLTVNNLWLITAPNNTEQVNTVTFSGKIQLKV